MEKGPFQRCPHIIDAGCRGLAHNHIWIYFIAAQSDFPGREPQGQYKADHDIECYGLHIPTAGVRVDPGSETF